jgi:hypothetical protein
MDWITLCVLGCVVTYAFVKYVYPKRFQEFIMLPVNNKYFLVHGKNDQIRHPFNILLFAAQVISVSLFVFLILKLNNPEAAKTNPRLFVQICTGYSIFVFIKFSAEKIVGSIFSIDAIVNNYLYQKLSYRNILAVIILLVNIVFFYIVEPSITGIAIFMGIIVVFNCIALFYSYKTIGNLILSNFFYFILYLCAFEISPYILLYKVLLQ